MGWDLKSSPEAPILQIKNKGQWVSKLKFVTPYNFVSSDYSGDLKFWDIRNNKKYIHCLEGTGDKIFDFDLIAKGGAQLLSGGANGNLKLARFYI